MPSIDLTSLLGAYLATDFEGVRRGGSFDCGVGLTAALKEIAAKSPANGTLYLPPGDYRISTTFQLVSNVEVLGAGSATRLLLDPTGSAHVISANGISNMRIRHLRIDGNRSNATGGGAGIYLTDATDCWLEHVEIVSCEQDGIFLDHPQRVEILSCSISDSGRHGISINGGQFCHVNLVRSYNNGRVLTGDGLNLDVFTHDCMVIGGMYYETAMTGGVQDYGVREVSGGGCKNNLVIAGFNGNATGAMLLEPDSFGLTYNGFLTTAGFGLNTLAPNASALLDLVSTRQGLGVMAMTQAQRVGIVSPRAGLLVYDTTNAKLYVRTASAWEAVTSA